MLYTPQQARRPRLVYEVPAVREDWDLGEDTVPESTPHDRVAETLRRLLDAWIERTGRDAVVCRNLAVRWVEERPSIGVDPDVCVLSPPPPDADDLLSLRTWETGHFPPVFAIEVVSTSRPDKDYGQSPAKYALNGTRELVVFDPKLAGSKAHGGPLRLQVWRREGSGDFVRVYAGEGPAWSEALGAWLFAVNEGRALRIADDEAGTSWWMTNEEAERARAEAERARAEAERARAEAERAAKEEAQQKAERLAQKLREMGIDPDSLAAR